MLSSSVPIASSMHTTPYYVPVFALVYSCIPSVLATAEFQQEKGSYQNESHVLGPVSQLRIVNKIIAPDGFSRSLSYIRVCFVHCFVLTSSRTVLAEGTFPGPLIAAQKVRFFYGVVHYLF